MLLAALNQPRLLELFCCEGGGAVGYHRAGFRVYGADLFRYRNAAGKLTGFSQRRYPFPSVQMDALELMGRLLAGEAVEFVDQAGISERLRLSDFAAVHASPPCQHYSITKHAHNVVHADLVGPTRDLLIASGLPYVIENVEGAPLLNPTMLCWSMFFKDGSVLDDDRTPLRMERHRLFESNVDLGQPPHARHDQGVQVAGSYGGARRDKVEARMIRKGGYVPSKAVQQKLLGIDWMTTGGMYQSLPPAYTTWVGERLLAACVAV